MGRLHVDHGDIARFAQERVNLPKDKADEYRAQVRRLRERLETYLDEHPDFTLKKMQLSGSLAKGTALRSLNDIDVACYISGGRADGCGGAAELSRRAAAQGRPQFQPRSGQAADLQRDGVVPGFGPRRRCRADSL
jgi:nucleotidyltransferase-like protein